FAARFRQEETDALRVWEVESGRVALAIGDFEPDAFAFGAGWSDQPWVAVGRRGGRIEIYSLGDSSAPRERLLGSLPVKPGWKTLCASRDGRLLAVNAYGEFAVDL